MLRRVQVKNKRGSLISPQWVVPCSARASITYQLFLSESRQDLEIDLFSS